MLEDDVTFYFRHKGASLDGCLSISYSLVDNALWRRP